MTTGQLQRKRPRSFVWIVGAIVITAAIAAVAGWVVVHRETYVVAVPSDARVETYSMGADTNVLYANLVTGPGEELVSAHAVETESTVTLHVEVLSFSGPTLAVGLLAAEPIQLDSPLGARTVLNAQGQNLREVPYQPQIGTVAQVVALWQEQAKEPVGTLVGDVRAFEGSMGEDGQGARQGQTGVVLGLDIRNEADGSMRTFDTDGLGHYVIPLRPGRYTLLCSPEREVLIEAGSTIHMDCDRPIP